MPCSFVRARHGAQFRQPQTPFAHRMNPQTFVRLRPCDTRQHDQLRGHTCQVTPLRWNGQPFFTIHRMYELAEKSGHPCRAAFACDYIAHIDTLRATLSHLAPQRVNNFLLKNKRFLYLSGKQIDGYQIMAVNSLFKTARFSTAPHRPTLSLISPRRECVFQDSRKPKLSSLFVWVTRVSRVAVGVSPTTLREQICALVAPRRDASVGMQDARATDELRNPGGWGK